MITPLIGLRLRASILSAGRIGVLHPGTLLVLGALLVVVLGARRILPALRSLGSLARIPLLGIGIVRTLGRRVALAAVLIQVAFLL